MKMTQISKYKALNARHNNLKQLVKDHWQRDSCESRAGKGIKDREQFFSAIDAYRYEKSPFIFEFADFKSGKNKKVLEIGLGSGSDFMQWLITGAILYGIDLTETSVQLCLERLKLRGLSADVRIGDAENLQFDDEFFDIVYAYGVIHHTPDTEKALREIHRVLKIGGTAKIMMYNARGLSFKYNWIMHALIKKFEPWKSIREMVFYHNESVGTKIYTKEEVKNLFCRFRKIDIKTIVDAGDTLNFQLSDKYKDDILVKSLQRIFGFIKYFRPYIPSRLGSTMLVQAVK